MIISGMMYLHEEFETNHQQELEVVPKLGVRALIDFDVNELKLVCANVRVMHRDPTAAKPVGEFEDVCTHIGVTYYIKSCKQAQSDSQPLVIPYWYVPVATKDATHHMEKMSSKVFIEYAVAGYSPSWDDVEVPCMANVKPIKAGEYLVVSSAPIAAATDATTGAAAPAASASDGGVPRPKGKRVGQARAASAKAQKTQ